MTAQCARRPTGGVKEVGKTSSAEVVKIGLSPCHLTLTSDHEAGAARPGRGCDGELVNLNLAPLGARAGRSHIYANACLQVFWRTFEGLGALAFHRQSESPRT